MAMGDFASSIIGHFGESLGKEILSSMEKEQTHALVLNEERLSKEAFKSLFPAVREHPFIENAFYYDKADYDFGKSILHASGAIYIQDASAMMPVHFLNPKRGDTCIDLCAAPGGKTIDASLKIGMEGSIVSNDLSFPRAKELSSNIERLGLGNTIIMSVQPSLLSKFYGPTFDNVILDAPCSGSAMFRKNELSESDWTENKVLGNAKTQRELLEIADEYGIDAPDDLNRQFIIGDLLELAGELEDSEKKKEKETIVLSDGEEEEININVLPESYNETKINVILRNPVSLFVWWDLNEWAEKKIRSEKASLRLVVYFFDSLEDEKPEDMFDIQLSMEDREKYVIIPGSKKIARVDLISESLGKSDDILAHSEKIVLPKGGEIMASKPGEKLHVSKIMELSGAADLLRRHYNIYRQSFY